MHIRRFNRKSIVGRYAVMDGDKVVSRHQTSEQAKTSRKLVEASLARAPSPQRRLVPAPSPSLAPASSPSLPPAPSVRLKKPMSLRRKIAVVVTVMLIASGAWAVHRID